MNGRIDLDTIRSFRVTLEDAFVQNSIFAPEPDAQDPGADTSARLYADAYSGSTQLSVSGKSPGSVTVTAIGVEETISCSIRCSCCPAATCRTSYMATASCSTRRQPSTSSAAATWPGWK
ncbi:MAG: hypothetical protein ACLU3I_04660 [Acutalibacteraceae bacterium]